MLIVIDFFTITNKKGCEHMGEHNTTKHSTNKDDQGNHFKGTFIAVMLLGLFILVFWFGIYALFLSR